MERPKRPEKKEIVQDRSKERQLPKDWYGDYKKICNTKKELEHPNRKGMFTFPEDIIGLQNIGDKKFLVFYFDYGKEEDYEIVRKCFEKLNTKSRAHPVLDTPKLVELVKGK